jgi:hypothetical protein
LQQQVSAGRLKNRDKIHVRIGRILASHPQVADLYQVAVKEQSGQLSLEWSAKEGQQQWRETREGAYLLRTNLTATTAAELWEKYMQLTEVEAAFRALKSELSIRPLFHQLERRVKAHVLVAFLGYALWVTLKHLGSEAIRMVGLARASYFLAQKWPFVKITSGGIATRVQPTRKGPPGGPGGPWGEMVLAVAVSRQREPQRCRHG